MSNEVDAFLAHYGVPGMRWGKRKAVDTTGAPRKTFGERYAEKGQARIARSGGTGKALVKVAGRRAAVAIMASAGPALVRNLPASPSTKTGALVAINLVNTAMSLKDTNDALQIGVGARVNKRAANS